MLSDGLLSFYFDEHELFLHRFINIEFLFMSFGYFLIKKYIYFLPQ